MFALLKIKYPDQHLHAESEPCEANHNGNRNVNLSFPDFALFLVRCHLAKLYSILQASWIDAYTFQRLARKRATDRSARSPHLLRLDADIRLQHLGTNRFDSFQLE
jgi:hypothetical protein